MVTYQLEPNLSLAEFIDVLVRSTLAERRPVSLAVDEGHQNAASVGS